MSVMTLHDKQIIETFFRQNPNLHIYSIGDLDTFFWNYTTWYAWHSGGEIRQIALVYSGFNPSILLALSETPSEMAEFVELILPLLPKQIYAHLSPGVVTVLQKTYQTEFHGMYYKMALANDEWLDQVDTSRVMPLDTSHLDEIKRLYQASYPTNAFDPRMLETGYTYGIRQKGTLIAIAGIHVYSSEYRVAALGNITTHPDYRGQGLATVVTAKLCQMLRPQVDHIGLNVKQDNIGAITCYKKLGFEQVAEYEEWMLTLQF